METALLQFLISLFFLTSIFLHVTHKNLLAVRTYSFQSVLVLIFLVNFYLESLDPYMLIVITLTLIVKVFLAPLFFTRLIKRHTLAFSVSKYLNTPLTLTVIAGLTFMTHTHQFLPLTNIVPLYQPLLALTLATMFISLFLVINRKGALSQILGILSFENSIIAFILFANLEQAPGLQIGIIFNIFIWIMIATVFISMMYRHFGTLNVTTMNHLTD